MHYDDGRYLYLHQMHIDDFPRHPRACRQERAPRGALLVPQRAGEASSRCGDIARRATDTGALHAQVNSGSDLGAVSDEMYSQISKLVSGEKRHQLLSYIMQLSVETAGVCFLQHGGY